MFFDRSVYLVEFQKEWSIPINLIAQTFIYTLGFDMVTRGLDELYKISIDGSEWSIIPNVNLEKFSRGQIAGVSGDYIYYWADGIGEGQD